MKPKKVVHVRKEGRMWYVRLRGCSYPLGPIEAPSALAARRKANRLGIKPVAEVWETSREAIDSTVQERQRRIDELEQAGRGTGALVLADV